MKRLMFALIAVVLSTMLMIGLLFGLDLYLHHRFEKVAGLNIHGYRGRVVGRKLPGEQRMVVLGGSTALGYGVPPQQAFPAVLERRLNEERAQAGPVTVVNLAYNTEGAYAFLYNLRYYEKLNYDIALFYTGYNDLGEEWNRFVHRRRSPVFLLTGYMPIFPLIFQEKAMALRYGGDLDGAYRGKKTVFRPNLAQRATASTLEAAVRISRSLEQQLGPLSKEPPEFTPLPMEECPQRWKFYCNNVYRAVHYVLGRGRWAIVVTQPYVADGHIVQQAAMSGMLRSRFKNHPRLRYVNLGRTVDLKDSSLAFDGMHLTAEGNQRIATALLPHVREVLAAQAAEPSSDKKAK